jgi:hypothetical protein
MRSVISRIGTAGVAAVFAVYITAVSTYGSSHEFNPWPYPWLWYLVAGLTVFGFVWIAAELLVRGRGKGPDFILRWRGNQMWEIERIRESRAERVMQGEGIIATTNIRDVGHTYVGDMDPGDRKIIGAPNDKECFVPFSWIEKTGTYYSKSARLFPGSPDIEVTGIRAEPGKTIQT